MKNKLDKLFLKSQKLEIDESSKFVIMSDIHRGIGEIGDNFVHNKPIFEAALKRYYDNGYTYIELGDGDDMWEVKNYKEIIKSHISTFKLLKKFHEVKKLIMINGNHDICKQNKAILKDTFYYYRENETNENVELLNDLKIYESIILKYKNNNIFLLHGHQVDCLNSTFWRISRFLVRYIWKPLEKLGIKDPTSAAKNYKGTRFTSKKLENWSKKNQVMVIAGHTHKPNFPKPLESLYFNDGTAIHPNGITCIEIVSGKITLVKWDFKIEKDNLVAIRREVIGSSENISDYFK